MSVILTLFGSILTVALGAYLAYNWQSKSSREARFYEATKRTLDGMLEAHRRVARNVGRRVYAAQRVLLMRAPNPSFGAAAQEFRDANLIWNNELLMMEVDVITLFKGPALLEFEALQREMRSINNAVSSKITGAILSKNEESELIYRTQTIRNQYFLFVRDMIRETDILFRQMHYGVIVEYDRSFIDQFTTRQLLKALWSGPIDQSAVLGAPENFGLPVRIEDLRLGVH